MALEKYISELLYRYNCVVVPEFGAFLSQQKPAKLHESTNAFYPPTKILSFNGQLTSNDGLLVSYMAESESISYETMLKEIAAIVIKWKGQLDKGERLVFDNIGELRLNSDYKLIFQPYENENYLTSSFGMSSYVSSPITREVLKEEVVELEERIPFIITPEERKKSTYAFRPYLKYAAIFLLALSTSLTAYRFYNDTKDNDLIARKEAEQTVSKHIQQATFFDTTPLELPSISLDIINKKEKVRMHHIVAGAFRFKANAENKINELNQQGFNPSYLGTNDFGLHMVAYESFSDADKALQSLREIKRTKSKDAWLKSEK